MTIFFSILIPTHNRPKLLLEAIDSVLAQTYNNWEIIIIDDGSSPPVNVDTLPTDVRGRYKIIRHKIPKGIAEAKNAGIAIAEGEVTLHLDDDDKLSNNTLESIYECFRTNNQIDCCFINVEPFGRLAEGTKENQSNALSKVIKSTSYTQKDDVILFSDFLFHALLKSVPMAFQRPACTIGAWKRIGLLNNATYLPEPEWALRASLELKLALITTPLYLVRTEGQSYVTNTTNQEKQILSVIDTRKNLLELLERDLIKFKSQRSACKKSTGSALFNHAYINVKNNNRLVALRSLLEAFRYNFEFKYFKLLIRIFL